MNIQQLSLLDSFQLRYNNLPAPDRAIRWADLKVLLTLELFTQNLAITGNVSITGTLTTSTLISSPTQVSISSPLVMSGTPQTLTGAGAVNLTTYSTLLVTTGANALTLAAGAEGQFKFIKMKTDGGDGTLTVTNLQGGTTITFNDAGDFVHLFYQDSKWNILTNSGCTVA